MKKKPKTKVAIVIDRSGSMWSTRDQVVEGYNEHVQQLKENAKDQDIEVSLVTFNGNVYEQFWNEPAEKLQEATIESFVPGGATAFVDAMGYVIDKYLSEEPDPDCAYLIVAISDGKENASQQYTPPMITELVEGCHASGCWTITYMGCSESDLKQVQEMTGISASNMAKWDNKKVGTARGGMRKGKEKMGRYMAARCCSSTSGHKMVMEDFHSDVLGVSADYCDVDEPAKVDESTHVTVEGEHPNMGPKPKKPYKPAKDFDGHWGDPIPLVDKKYPSLVNPHIPGEKPTDFPNLSNPYVPVFATTNCVIGGENAYARPPKSAKWTS